MTTMTTFPSDTAVAVCHVVSESDLVPSQSAANAARPTSDYRRQRRLRAGPILRLLDCAACLSAEKFSSHTSVTLSVDDVTFEDPNVRVGEVLVFRSCVNAAWGTSMEVGVLCQAVGGGGDGVGRRTRRICRAFTTFVALDSEAKKVRLPKLTSATDEDVMRRRMAEERRGIRFRRGEILRRGSDDGACGGGEGGGGAGGDAGFEDGVTFTELVLPQHANHHGNAFGGQIMDWMDKAAVVAALRHAGGGGGVGEEGFAVRSIDDVFFVGPSNVGDRLEIAARPACRLTERELEVSVEVTAFGLDRRERRMVNRAFVVVEAVRGDDNEADGGGDDDGDDDEKAERMKAKERFVFLDVVPATPVQSALKAGAVGRAALRLERLAVRSDAAQAEEIPWNFPSVDGGGGTLAAVVEELCAQNVLLLLQMRWMGDWIEVVKPSTSSSGRGGGGGKETQFPTIQLHYRIDGAVLRGRVGVSFPPDVNADDIFEVLLDNESRSGWSPHLVSAERMASIDENNDVQRLVMQSIIPDAEGGETEGTMMELVVLRSWRRDSPQTSVDGEEGGGAPAQGQGQGRRKRRVLVIANHSINHPAAPMPPPSSSSEAIPRGFVGSSGWIVEEGEGVSDGDGEGGGGRGGKGGTITYLTTFGASSSKLARDVILGQSCEMMAESLAGAVAVVRERTRRSLEEVQGEVRRGEARREGEVS